MSLPNLIPGDATLIENIVDYLKAKGIFDEFRHECLADVDTKSSCQNLSQRVDGYTSKFLANETWHPDLNKNELRNKLRRHIDEAGFLAPGADIVVEQAIAPKTYYFLPKVIEVVHQYIKEQTELLNKKPESTVIKSSISEKSVSELENKDKAQVSDPIADILSFSFHAKTENVQHKHGETIKVEKKKEEKIIPAVEKSIPEGQAETVTSSCNETKVQLEKEKDKIKKEDPENQPEVLKKIVKDENKSEKKKADDVKTPVSEVANASEESKSTAPVSSKSNVSSKKDDKNKHKSKSQNIHKSSSSSSEIKKSKKESSEKSSDKLNKTKSIKSSKESASSPAKSSSSKNMTKDEKVESSKTKSHDATSSKTSESPIKKSKSSSDKKDNSSSKHKSHSEKADKLKTSKSADKTESHIHHESSNNEKNSKTIQYSSSYDSSQGSDQDKSASTSSKKEKSKHFSKHASKEKSDHDSSNKTDKRRPNSGSESPSKKYKNEKDAKFKLKDTSAVEAAKITSRSNSFGSTSSVSSSSNTSKDNLTSTTDEVSENSAKDKKKKQPKEKDSCHNSPKSLPPPPPPPPPPPSLSSELPSSAEMSSVDDTQSSLSESETSSNDGMSEDSSSDSELESKDLINDTLNENALNSSTDNINAFYDIFLYSSSSSEFEGYGNSPEKKNDSDFANMCDSDVSISSVHTSDLSSFDDELSSDDEVAILTGGLKKRLTLKEAQELIENRANLDAEKKVESKTDSEDSFNKQPSRNSTELSFDEEQPPSEPVRSLRRERKLNPRYSSSEYTSIFNCKKESFITKQASPSARSQTSTSSPKVESKSKKTESLIGNNKIQKESITEDKKTKTASNDVEISENCKYKLRNKSHEKDDELSDNKMSSSDELDSFMDKEKLFKENNKNNLITDDDKLKDNKMLKPHNNSKLRRNSHSLKRKLEVTESTPVKRPCSRSSVDSSSSEFAPNENKPFNSEKKDFNEEKKLNDCSLKVSNLNIGIKKDMFCKQRANNNGDILGQKDIFPKNSHNKVISNSEKKTNESDASKELSSL